jgi:Phage integrase, N-terminal SAM-like domain
MTPLRTPMTPLRAKMLHQLQLHRLASHTQKAYVQAVEDVARFYWRSPDQLTADEIRDYLHHLLVDRQLAWSTCNIVAAGLRFFYLDSIDTMLVRWFPERVAVGKLLFHHSRAITMEEKAYDHRRAPL